METQTPFSDIPSNSIKNSTQPKRTEVKDYSLMPAGTNSVTASKDKKKGLFLSLILPEDVPDISTYLSQQGASILKYIIWPKIQQILLESFSSVIGLGTAGKNSNISGSINRVSYDSKYRNVGAGLAKSNVDYNRQNSSRYSLYENIGFDDPEEADAFMSLVEELFHDQEGYITVLQFYNIARRQTSPEQNNYGWLSIGAMKRAYSNGKYYVDMPWPVPLN